MAVGTVYNTAQFAGDIFGVNLPTFSGAADQIGSWLGFGSSDLRDNRAKRDAGREYLYSVGVQTFGTHSNRWPEVHEVAELVSQYGRPAVEIVNERIDYARKREGKPNIHRSTGDYDWIISQIKSYARNQTSTGGDPTARPADQVNQAAAAAGNSNLILFSLAAGLVLLAVAFK